MGDVMTELRTKVRKSLIPAVTGIALLAIGCASSTPGSVVEEPIAVDAVSEGNAAPAVTLRAIDLQEGAPGARLALRGDGPLIWTSYRDAEGNLILELPNTTVASEVGSLHSGEGLIAAVEVGAEADAGRPLTRLRIVTREEAEHTVASDGDRLEVRLVPVGSSVQEDRRIAQAPDVEEEAGFEPLPDPVIAEPEPFEQAQAEPPPSMEKMEKAATTEVASVPQAIGSPESPLAGPAPAGITATRLDAIEVADGLGDTEVRLVGDGGFRYSTFLLDDPPRFVVDLDGVVNLSSQRNYDGDGVRLTQVRVAQYQAEPQPVARVVLDLEERTPPRIEPTADGLVLRFGPSGAPATVVETAEAPAPPLVGDDGVGEVALAEGAEDAAEPMVFEAMTAAAAETPEPAPEMPATEYEDVAAATGSWASDAPELVSDVALFEAQDTEIPTPAPVGEPVVGAGTGYAPTEVRGQGKSYYGEPMSLSLKDADIKDVLRSFSKISGLNIVVQPGVRGTVTVELEAVPWDQALEQILKVNQLGMVLEGNILRIAPISTLRQEAQEEARLRAAQTRSQPLRTVIKRLSYARSSEVLRLLSARRSGVRVMSSRGQVSVDRRTNTLIIKELPSYMDTVISIIEHLDSPEPQVMIEARIVETQKQLNQTLGIAWGFDGAAVPDLGTTTGLQFPATAASAGGVTLLSGGQAGFLNLALGNLTGSFNLDIALRAFESQGLVNVLSAPRIATLNNEKASIQSGLQIPVQTVRNNTVTVQYINATLRLEVTPQVTAEGTILMDIRVQKREPDLAFAIVGATNAPINTKEARTNVMVRDGGTTVIGGIYEISAEKGEDRVPGLANIPILGHIFRNKRKTQENKELLIFITPRVIQF